MGQGGYIRRLRPLLAGVVVGGVLLLYPRLAAAQFPFQERPPLQELLRDPYVQAALRDELLVGLSYVWLCCGVITFLSAPFVLIILGRRGKRQAEKGKQ